MAYSEDTSKSEVYSNTSLSQEARKIPNKQCNFASEGTRKRKNKAQSQQKGNNKDQGGKK